MKDQYFGDRRDYLKYHVLESLLAGLPSLAQLTCLWMRTPDDGSNDGNVPLVPSAELPRLTDFLRHHVRSGDRRIFHLRDYFAEARIRYNPHGDEGHEWFSTATRDRYFRDVPDDHLRGALVFLDPDNGITWGKPGTEHVGIDELRSLWERMDDESVLAVVQFAHRKPEFFPRRSKELQAVFDRPVLWIQEHPIAVYVVAKAMADDPRVEAALREVAAVGRNRVVGNSSTWTTREDHRQRGATVYLLWHGHGEDLDDPALLGVYSTRQKAEARQREAAFLPGFRREPSRFVIDEYLVDEDQWQEGTDETNQGRTVSSEPSGERASIPLPRPAPRASRRGGATTVPGFINRNRQTVVRATGLPGTDHGQSVYVLRCGKCGSEYGSNGSDISQRKCPVCQGGRPGLPSGTT